MSAPTELPRCPTTTKVCYPSAKFARRVMRKFSARLRAYRCPHCKAVHLTKQGDGGARESGRRRGRPHE